MILIDYVDKVASQSGNRDQVEWALLYDCSWWHSVANELNHKETHFTSELLYLELLRVKQMRGVIEVVDSLLSRNQALKVDVRLEWLVLFPVVVLSVDLKHPHQ